MSAREAQGADAGARFSPDGGASQPWRGRGVRIPTLAEVLDRFGSAAPDRGEGSRGPQAVRQALLDHDATGRCVVASEQAAHSELFGRRPFSKVLLARISSDCISGRFSAEGRGRALSAAVGTRAARGLPIILTRRFIKAARPSCPGPRWYRDKRGWPAAGSAGPRDRHQFPRDDRQGSKGPRAEGWRACDALPNPPMGVHITPEPSLQRGSRDHVR